MKNLEALQIYRDEDTHVVEHHHTAGPPKTHRFKSRNQAAAHILGNLERLAPPQSGGIEEQDESRPDSWMGGRPAGFDHGSTREGEIQGRRK
jgi:hypothetical protein